jgi:prepilin-type N-terminal cleavage/methylation domain-containing protein
MLKLRKMFKKNRKGFTLIELIVVIAILGIIALLAIPRFIGTLDRARINTHNANVRSLQSAANVALAEHGKPDSDVSWSSTAGGSGDFLRDNYVDAWPVDPRDDGDYIVTIGSDGIISVNPDIATLD